MLFREIKRSPTIKEFYIFIFILPGLWWNGREGNWSNTAAESRWKSIIRYVFIPFQLKAASKYRKSLVRVFVCLLWTWLILMMFSLHSPSPGWRWFCWGCSVYSIEMDGHWLDKSLTTLINSISNQSSHELHKLKHHAIHTRNAEESMAEWGVICLGRWILLLCYRKSNHVKRFDTDFLEINIRLLWSEIRIHIHLFVDSLLWIYLR